MAGSFPNVLTPGKERVTQCWSRGGAPLWAAPCFISSHLDAGALWVAAG